MINASCSCLWQIFNNRWQFTDIPVCSWQYPDVNGCSCLVTSPISSEIQGKMSRWEVQSVLTIMKGHNFMFNTVTDYSCGLMAAARCNKVSMYKLWHKKTEHYGTQCGSSGTNTGKLMMFYDFCFQSGVYTHILWDGPVFFLLKVGHSDFKPRETALWCLHLFSRFLFPAFLSLEVEQMCSLGETAKLTCTETRFEMR